LTTQHDLIYSITVERKGFNDAQRIADMNFSVLTPVVVEAL